MYFWAHSLANYTWLLTNSCRSSITPRYFNFYLSGRHLLNSKDLDFLSLNNSILPFIDRPWWIPILLQTLFFSRFFTNRNLWILKSSLLLRIQTWYRFYPVRYLMHFKFVYLNNQKIDKKFNSCLLYIKLKYEAIPKLFERFFGKFI